MLEIILRQQKKKWGIRRGKSDNMNKLTICIFGLVVLVANVVLILLGLQCNTSEFFKISLNGILTMDITALVMFFWVQNILSKRRGNDFIVKELDNVLSDIHCEYLFDHSQHKQASIKQRVIANKLKNIGAACPKSMKSETSDIYNKFETLRTYYGDHGDAPADDVYYERTRADLEIKIIKVQLHLFGFKVSTD